MSEKKAMHAPPPKAAVKPADSLKVRRVECEELVVKGPGKSGFKVTASAVKDMAGIWIEGPDGAEGPLVSIYQSDRGGGRVDTCVGVYGPGEKRCVNLGLTVDDDGSPVVQIARGGEVRHLTWDQLAGLA